MNRPKSESSAGKETNKIADSADSLIGSTIGKYKVLQRIGEGGFGIVYMAQQTESVRRKVALKVIKPGMDTREVIARFEAERQALALMDHSNVAHLLDAGTTNSGYPYFVMELVKGIPITDFCDENRLDTRARLELFETVCDAVQHAHRKGIIHRDIKPSNVMVAVLDGKPRPKVIDFGIAKAVNRELTEKTLFTKYGHLVGTPQYMSPEQAAHNAADVDTRSDVYSLGVVLYELLTGTTPTDSDRLKASAFDEMRRIIREEELPTPSHRLSSLDAQSKQRVALHRESEADQLRKQLRGELDWIVMCALEKDRDRRYDGPKALAKDVRRHLTGETVEACPPSWTYKTGKLFRKHRLVLGSAATIVTLLALGILGTAFAASRASRLNEQLEMKNEDLAEQGRRLADRNVALASSNLRIANEHLSRAFAAAQNNNAARARKMVEAARELSASEVELEIILGSIAATEDIERAISHFKRAIELDPRSVAAHGGLGYAYGGVGNFRGMTRCTQAAEALTPETAFDFQFLSFMSLMGNRSAEAIEAAARGLQLTDSAAARSMASRVFSTVALATDDIRLAQQANEYASEAAIRLGPNHYLGLSTKMLALDALVVLKRKSGEDYQGHLQASTTCADQLFHDIETIIRINPGFGMTIASHYRYIDVDLDKAERVFQLMLPHGRGELFAFNYASLLLKRYGVERALTMFENVEEDRSSWSHIIELYLRSISPEESDRDFARDRWRNRGNVNNVTRSKMLCVASAVGEHVAMEVAAMEWIADGITPQGVFMPEYTFVQFVAGDIPRDEYIARWTKDNTAIEANLNLGLLAYGQGDRLLAMSHLEEAVNVGNYGNWMHHWCDGMLSEFERRGEE